MTNESLYCRIHSRYEGKYLPDDIPNLRKCITCCFLTKPTPITKQCENCFSKNPIRVCKWKNRTGLPCSRNTEPLKSCCKEHIAFENYTFDDCVFCKVCRTWFIKAENDKCPKCYPTNTQCLAIKHNGTLCGNRRKNGCVYCGAHSYYENQFTPDELKDLPFCKGCHRSFRKDDKTNHKLCESCLSRVHTTCVDDTTKQMCKAYLLSSGEPCSNYSKNNTDYCGLHSNYAKHKELIDSGKLICSNWIRGCWNETTSDLAKCEECRLKERNSSNKQRNEKHTQQSMEREKDVAMLTCVKCSESKKPDDFIHTVDSGWGTTSNPRTTVECKDCREKSRMNDLRSRRKREIIPRKTIKREDMEIDRIIKHKYYDYKNKDISNCLISGKDEYEEILPKIFAFNLMKQPCTYCGEKSVKPNVNGLDRLDNTKGHIKGNVVPCCDICNTMKQRMTLFQFESHIQKIYSNLKKSSIKECPF
jgi:hypothetical protein